MSKDNQTHHHQQGHQNYTIQRPFSASTSLAPINMKEQVNSEIAAATEDETQMSQLSGVALGPSMHHLPDEYMHLLHPSSSQNASSLISGENFTNSTFLSGEQPTKRPYHGFEGQYVQQGGNFRCSTPNTAVNENDCFQKLLFPGYRWPHQTQNDQNHSVQGIQDHNRTPLGELSINNGLPAPRPLSHFTFTRSASSSSILTANNGNSQTVLSEPNNSGVGRVPALHQGSNGEVNYSTIYIHPGRNLSHSASDLTQNVPNSANMTSCFYNANQKPMHVVSHLPPMVQRNPAVPVSKTKPTTNQPDIPQQQTNPLRVNSQMLSIGLPVPQKPLTFNLKALTFITMQFLKKNIASSNENILNYIMGCLNGISSEKMTRKSKEGISLKRRIYDTINVMICLGLVKQSYITQDEGRQRHIVYEWNGFDQFWEVSAARKEEVMLLKQKNKSLRAKLVKLQRAKNILAVHHGQMTTPMYLSIPFPKLCLRIPKTSVQMIESDGKESSKNLLKLTDTHQMEVMTDPVGILNLFYSYAYATNDY